MTDSIVFLAGELEKANLERMNLEERVSDLALRLDSIGWEPASGWDEDGGLTLEALKQTSLTLKDMVATAPLMKRAVQLRHGYTFAKGMQFKNLKPRHKKIMAAPYNKAALFSSIAQEELMGARLTDGNIFTLRSKTTEPEFYRVPLAEVTGVMTDPQSNERVWAIQRTHNVAKGRDKDRKVVWYYTSTFTGRRQNSIDGKPVDNTHEMIHIAFNRQVGFTWGVPDGYAAITWAIAYGEYLKNNSKLVKAYANIAYKASTKTAAGGQNIAAQISQPGVAGTAITGPNTDLVPMPRAGSDVSFENGRPLASMVAAALGVSVVALLSDPGAAGSSYGSAQTLDAPTIIVMTSIQEGWKVFYEEIFRGSKGEDVTVEFPNIESDQAYRIIQSLAMAYTTGGLHQEEFRLAVLKVLDIPDPLTGLPVPDSFNAGHLTPQELADAALAQAVQSGSNSVASQGNSGATGGDKSVSNHDADPDSFGNEN